MSDYRVERSDGLYKSLGIPWIYKIISRIITPGGRENLLNIVRKTIESHPDIKTCLDVGCGPRSLLSDTRISFIGLDISLPYLLKLGELGVPAVVASASDLPFISQSFDAVWSVGMFHHLNESLARNAIQEMRRVCSPGGHIFILDAVLPSSFVNHPIPYLIRKLDRGKFVRKQDKFTKILINFGIWKFERIKYTSNGLEVLLAIQERE